MRTLACILFLFQASLYSVAQSSGRPYRCGYYPKTTDELTRNFQLHSRHFGVLPGETVASVGASNGYIEVQIAVFTDSVQWTIQDIDSTCLNAKEFSRVLDYHRRLKGDSIRGHFEFLHGTLKQTNLR